MNSLLTSLRRLAVSPVLGLALAGCGAARSPAARVDLPVEARLAAYMAGVEQWGFSGAVLVARGERILLEAGYGFADPASRTPATARTIFDLGSLAKQYTAAAVLLLQDEGRLSVQDTLGGFFPATPPDKAGITLHQILTHTSGITREVGRDWEITDRVTFEQRVLASDLLFTPGSGFSYSNAGFALLAAIIERVTGEPFHEFMEDDVFGRAALRHTGFIGRSPDPAHTAAAASGATAGQNPADWPHTWNHRGSGGLLSTVGDFRRWRRALQAGRVISPAAVTAMHTPYGNGYGYGVEVGEGEFGPVYRHTGLWYSFTSRFSEFPRDSVLVVAVSNGRMGTFQPASVVARDLADEVFGRPGPVPPDVERDRAPRGGIAGTYRTSGGGTVHVAVADDHLLVNGDGQDVFDVLFSDGTPTPDLLSTVRTRTIAILRGVHDRNFDTLAVAAPRGRYERYRRLLPPIWDAREDSLGPFGGVHFVGTADRGPALDAYAVLRFALGSEGVRLTWSRDGGLMALANEDPTMDSGLLTFRRTPDGSFVAYHFETRVVVRVQFADDRLVALNAANGLRLTAARDPEE